MKKLLNTSNSGTIERQKLIRAGRFNWMHWLIISLSTLVTIAVWYFTTGQLNQKIEQQFTQILPIQNITPEDKTKIEKLSKKENEISEEQEINNALESLESMNFNDDMKQEAEEKIKARIVQAREERAKVLADEKQHREDLKEELILQNQLKVEKLKKDRELQEFWD